MDGKNIKDLNLKWLREQIGVVSQEPVLFDASIEENIRHGKVDASLEEIQAAAKMANAHGFIQLLPMVRYYFRGSCDKKSGTGCNDIMGRGRASL